MKSTWQAIREREYELENERDKLTELVERSMEQTLEEEEGKGKPFSIDERFKRTYRRISKDKRLEIETWAWNVLMLEAVKNVKLKERKGRSNLKVRC